MIVFDTNKQKYLIINKNDFKNESKYYEYLVKCKFNTEIVKPMAFNDIRTKINNSFGDKEYK